MATATRMRYSTKKRRELLREVVAQLQSIGDRAQVPEDILALMKPARQRREQASDADFDALVRGLKRLRNFAQSWRMMDPFIHRILWWELEAVSRYIKVEGRAFDIYRSYGPKTRPTVVKEIMSQLPELRRRAALVRDENIALYLELAYRAERIRERQIELLDDEFMQMVALDVDLLPRRVHWLLFEPLNRSGDGSAEHLTRVEEAFAALDIALRQEEERIRIATTGQPARKSGAQRSSRKARKAEDDRQLRNRMRGSGGGASDNAVRGLAGGKTRNAKKRHRRHGIAA